MKSDGKKSASLFSGSITKASMIIGVVELNVYSPARYEGD